VVRAGLADTVIAMDAYASGLLGRHQEVPLPPSARPTRWWRGFTMTGAGSAQVEVTEQAETLAAAASATGRILSTAASSSMQTTVQIERPESISGKLPQGAGQLTLTELLHSSRFNQR